MIKGIGNDIIEIERIAASIEKHGQHFLDRIFTLREQKYCLRHHESARHFAGRFAAKEAIVKAFGTGFREGISWLDIEIHNTPEGKPQVNLSALLQNKFDHPKIEISISHCRTYATAVAIWMEK